MKANTGRAAALGSKWRAAPSFSTTKLLKAGDGVAIDAPGVLRIEGQQEAEVLLFDMAM